MMQPSNVRLISKKQLLEIVPFSGSHIARLEKAGEFPKRIKIGKSKVAWSIGSVMEWIEERKQM